MKAVITRDLRLEGGALVRNAEFLRFAHHWGFTPRACRPYRAQTKGKVERPVRYLRGNFVYGRTFLHDADLDQQRQLWLERVANVRVHGTTRERPRVRFDREERFLLQPLAAAALHVADPRPAVDVDAARVGRRVPSSTVEKRSLAAYAQPRGRCRMKSAPLSRRDRLRHILADLRMPGALEALDAILHGVDGGTLTAPEAIEQLLAAQIQLRNNRRLQAAMRSSRLPVGQAAPRLRFHLSAVAAARADRESARARLRRAPRECDLPRAARRRQDAPGDQSGDRRGAERPARLLRHARRPDHLARRGAGRRPAAGAPEGAHASGAARRRRDRLSARSAAPAPCSSFS